MRLSRIILDGFKSFGSYTDVALASGLTAIVGPNGCGKSNLLDAVLWACGSRRWKSLRGSEMEDVVFNGTDQVSPAQRAHVRITFDNADNRLGFDADEVEIVRELFRGGPSESQLCGTPVRLKDVAAVVAGTGLGDDGFAVIRQGQIDRVILSGGEELHKAIEEAAGIARYRIRRQEAREKLDLVEKDVTELKRRIDRSRGELKRVKEKAAKAKKRGQLAARLEELRKILRAHEAWSLRTEIAKLEERFAAFTSQETDVTAKREAALAERARLEGSEDEEEKGPPIPGPAPSIGFGEALRAASIIEEGGRSLIDASRRLQKDGPPAWPEVRVVVEGAVAKLSAVVTGGQGAGPSKPRQLSEVTRLLKELNRTIESHTQTLLKLAGEAASVKERFDQARTKLASLGEIQAAEETPSEDVKRLAEEAGRVESEIASIGPVDETALAREAELTEEVTKLGSQREDLDAARSRLLAFISEVDLHAGHLYGRAMERTEQTFQKNIERLFGGGTASLQPLADGRVTVSVKLPGKKECELSLLSGGEKSLSGIALVLALAEAASDRKGGGVLVLDEVDAPLDEANVVRFAELLRVIALDNQVLCVTHNPRTMHAAQRIFGVTAGAAGISAVVSVRLESAAETVAGPHAAMERA